MAEGESCSGRQAGAEDVWYRQYKDETDLPVVMRLIDNELSEPYSIFTYRYFLHSWPHLCFLVFKGDHCFGTVVAKMDVHRGKALRGYIAMLTVEKPYRYLGVGSELVQRAIAAMVAGGCEEVALEAEVCNAGALRLYQKLGFIRDKRLQRYYLSGSDAYRLKLLLPIGAAARRAELEAAQELEALGLGEEQAGQQAVQQQQLEERLEQQLGEREGGAEQREAEEALVHMQQHGEHDHQAAS